MSGLIIFISILFAFLCGSMPSGYLLVKKMCGIDIRTHGSGNIGSTNVKRAAGRKVSIMTQALDVVKGIVPVAIAIYISNAMILPIDKNIYVSIVALAAIMGHNYTPFLKFNGGKGVNTTLGSFLLIAPIPTLSGVLMYFILRLFTSIVSIRSMMLGVTIPVVCAIMKLPSTIVIAAGLAAVLIIFRHKKNIKKLIDGTEK